MLTDEMKAQGWVEHDGGPCPVEADSKPLYMMRDGEIDDSRRAKASELIWDDACPPEDRIIAYKPEQPNG